MLSNPVAGAVALWITFCPVISPWSDILSDESELIPARVKVNSPITVFLLWALYLTCWVFVMIGSTSTKTVSFRERPWVPATETVTSFLSIWPLTTFLWLVCKLWFTPVPTPTKYSNPQWDVVSAIPTKVPVVPNPTRTEDKPIKSRPKLATNTFVPSVMIPTPAVASVWTPIGDPPLSW